MQDSKTAKHNEFVGKLIPPDPPKIRSSASPVAVKMPIIFKRWAAKLCFIKGYEAPHPITCLGEYNKMVVAASGNMVFLLCHDAVFRPMRFEVLNDKE